MSMIKKTLFFMIGISLSNPLTAMEQPGQIQEVNDATKDIVALGEEIQVTRQMIEAIREITYQLKDILVELDTDVKEAEKCLVDKDSKYEEALADNYKNIFRRTFCLKIGLLIVLPNEKEREFLLNLVGTLINKIKEDVFGKNEKETPFISAKDTVEKNKTLYINLYNTLVDLANKYIDDLGIEDKGDEGGLQVEECFEEVD